MAGYETHIQELTNRLTTDQGSLSEDAAYYEAGLRLKAVGVATPPEMRSLLAAVGWPRMYLDSLEERLDLEGFRLAGENSTNERLWHWWQSNDMDEESGLAHLEALIHGRAYVTVSAPDPSDPTADQEAPIIRVESPKTMIAETDPRTRKVTRALRLYQTPGAPSEDFATLYLPDRTVLLARSQGAVSNWTVVDTIQHNLGMVPVVPVLNRERLAHRFGHSEILPELRSITDAAARTMMNMQAATELMAVPQRLLFGVSQSEFMTDPDSPGAALDAYTARIMAFENESASATQFSAADLRNYTDVLQELAKHVASYTGLPPQYLSFSSDNPASAEAIRSSESRLVKKCERKARMFGGAWEQVMQLSMRIMDGKLPDEAHRMEAIWRDPSTPTYAAKADGVTKLYNNGMGVIPLERARIDMGYSSEERREMKEWDRESTTSQLSALLGTGVQEIPAPQQGDDAQDGEVPA